MREKKMINWRPILVICALATAIALGKLFIG